MKLKYSFVILSLFTCFLTLSAAPEVLRVIPNKINYNLNEKAIISVTLANKGNKAESAELILVDKWDIDRQKVIAYTTEYKCFFECVKAGVPVPS